MNAINCGLSTSLSSLRSKKSKTFPGFLISLNKSGIVRLPLCSELGERIRGFREDER
jgi:hypothetical protein